MGERIWQTPVLDDSGNLLFGTALDYLSLARSGEQPTSGRIVVVNSAGEEQMSQGYHSGEHRPDCDRRRGVCVGRPDRRSDPVRHRQSIDRACQWHWFGQDSVVAAALMRGLRAVTSKLQTGHKQHGFTLLELLLVMAIDRHSGCMATWGGKYFVRGWQLKRAGHQMLEDLKAVQARAEMSGSLTLGNGVLVMQRTFLVFDPVAAKLHGLSLAGPGW